MLPFLSIAFLFITSEEKDKPTIVVIDGDTFIYNGKKIRIIGIDAPELEKQKPWFIQFLLNISNGTKVNTLCLQYYAQKAREFLQSSLMDCNNLSVEIVKRDKYGRYLAYVYCGNCDIGEKEIFLGYAVVYPFENFSKKEIYYNLTLYAASRKVGLWKCVG